jgi:chorismate mutase/prephenate dehydratase
MSQNKTMSLRNQIDELDKDLLKLLGRRVELAQQVFKEKAAAGQSEPFTPEREVQLLDELKKQTGTGLSAAEIESVFLPVISLCRSRQKETKISVFGEQNGWTADAARLRFGPSAKINTVENAKDFFAEINQGNLGFACVTPQFTLDRADVLESILSGKIALIEEFVYSPVFALVSNSAKDLSEVQELCVTREMLTLLRRFFLSFSYDLKIKLCCSTSETFDSLKSIHPVAAILPAHQLNQYSDLHILKSAIKSEVMGPVKFMVFAKQLRAVDSQAQNLKAAILCAVNDADILAVMASFKELNLEVIDVQTIDFENKPWKKLIGIEIVAPQDHTKLQTLMKRLEEHCLLSKLGGIYPEMQSQA